MEIKKEKGTEIIKRNQIGESPLFIIQQKNYENDIEQVFMAVGNYRISNIYESIEELKTNECVDEKIVKLVLAMISIASIEIEKNLKNVPHGTIGKEKQK